jgi:hypothetical protein
VKRGQRRHFPSKNEQNEFELLMKSTGTKDASSTKIAVPQNPSSGKTIITRRGAGASNGRSIFESEQTNNASEQV